MTQRPKYPIEYYQILRKQANFGCAVCGIPIMKVHHIEPYRKVKKHELNNLILLCKEHHKLADSGMISKSELYKLKAHPFNSESVKHYFSLNARQMIVNISTYVSIDVPVPLSIKGKPVISLKKEEENILLSLFMENRYGYRVLEIRDNIWEGRTDLFDVWYSVDKDHEVERLTIKMQKDEPFTSIKIENEQIYILGRFYSQGHIIEAREDGIFKMDERLTLQNVIVKNAKTGININ